VRNALRAVISSTTTAFLPKLSKWKRVGVAARFRGFDRH
jgi:hypothetical protein